MVLVDLEERGGVWWDGDGDSGVGQYFHFFIFFLLLFFYFILFLLCGIHVSVRVSIYLPHVLKLTVLNLLSNGRVKLHKIFISRVKLHLKICQGQICTFWYSLRGDLHINPLLKLIKRSKMQILRIIKSYINRKEIHLTSTLLKEVGETS